MLSYDEITRELGDALMRHLMIEHAIDPESIDRTGQRLCETKDNKTKSGQTDGINVRD